jgi:hypothetical protein
MTGANLLRQVSNLSNDFSLLFTGLFGRKAVFIADVSAIQFQGLVSSRNRHYPWLTRGYLVNRV